MPYSKGARHSPDGNAFSACSTVAAIELPPALNRSEHFLNDQIGINLKVEVIAHDSQAQRALDENQITWGVQWELAPSVTLGAWRWVDVMKKLHLFRACFALGLLNSIPAIKLVVHNIEFIDKEYANNFDPNAGRKAEAEEILTDGCSFMNTAMAMEIRRVMIYTCIPTTVQGCIAGSIINLWFNGIPHGLLTNLLENGLREEAQPLMEWDQPNVMIHLWQAINKLGGVTTSRGQRLAANLGRALGLTARAWGHDRIELVDSAQDTSPIKATPAPSTTNRNPYTSGKFFYLISL
ncbi:hypothetical protein BDN72DRAFT_906999 [Pluteus cervinus]|uniref:Uncharacterized protein n=1 Tax=Pluteus cervinus TaxID=181527 RepID=A0ACD2ZXP6_9AGAR|nr:hypothetical protein BDN72DRAFT_906999 [Pluteus cervinus]